MVSRAAYVCLRREGGRLVRLLMGDGEGFCAEGVEIRAEGKADVSLQAKGGEWYYTASRPCTIRIAGESRRVEPSASPRRWGQ